MLPLLKLLVTSFLLEFPKESKDLLLMLKDHRMSSYHSINGLLLHNLHARLQGDLLDKLCPLLDIHNKHLLSCRSILADLGMHIDSAGLAFCSKSTLLGLTVKVAQLPLSTEST
jgi:hypothetical protein